MLMIRLFDAVKFLHSNRIIHRDIKPENILIDQDYYPFLADFDLIRPINESNFNDEIMTLNIGSIKYAPPEQIEDSKFDISYASDMYSFGQIIYYLFEHNDMFKDDFNCQSIIQIIKNSLIPPMKNTPIQIQSIIKSLTKYDPKDRMKENEIQNIIMEQINSLYFFEPSFLIKELKNTEKESLFQFINEIVLFLSKESANKEIFDFFLLF